MKRISSFRIVSLILAFVIAFAAFPISVIDTVYAADANETEDMIFTAREIYEIAEPGTWGGKYGCVGYDEATLVSKNRVEYVKLLSYGGIGTPEAYFHLFYVNHKVAPIIAIKYRTDTAGVNMGIFTDSVNSKVDGDNATSFSITADGEWHLITVDLTEKIAEYNGKTANYLRFDFLNASDSLPKNAYVDFGYIGFFNTVAEAEAYDEANYNDDPVYIDETSGYTESNLDYWSALDMINGMGADGADSYSNRGGDSKNGVDVISYNGETFTNNWLVFSGWTVVDGGISKYVWSADEGKTWNDVKYYRRGAPGDVANDHAFVTTAQRELGGVTLSAGSGKLSGYQCGAGSKEECMGLAADLTEFVGKTVDVTFAAVPLADTNTLCVLDFVEGVYVGDMDESLFSKEEYSNNNKDIIENANALANGVEAYFTGSERNEYAVENKNTVINYSLLNGGASTVAAITDKNGNSYIENTMKVFARTTDGKTYYASNYLKTARPNIYRLGYYYYDVHFMDTDFINSATVSSEKTVDISKFTRYSAHHSTKPTIANGEMSFTVTNALDTYVATNNKPNVLGKASDYNAVQITVKSESASSMDFMFVTSDSPDFSSSKGLFRKVIKNDGEWHTYILPTDELIDMGYTGDIIDLRFDFDGITGTNVAIKDVKLVNYSYDSIPLSLDRVFHTYSNKLHQEIHVVSYEDTANIEAIGVITEIDAETVDKIIVKDKSGEHTTLDSVDWASAEYIGFDIKNVGVFGIIIPFDGESGGMTVSLADGIYTITQECAPENGTILEPVYDTSNDFRMGHRIYTDTNHTFDAFLKEAYCERNPITEENIVIDTSESHRAKFKGYDPILGSYYFLMAGSASFSPSYYNTPNTHYSVSFGIKGDEYDRDIYVYTYTSSGSLECAALLDVNDMMLPVPLEVCKNFAEEEEPIYNCGDATYGNTIFPMTVGAEDNKYLTVLNLYQNWGKYPLKQISSIGFYVPYYHLSTGVTETNCISQYFSHSKNLQLLPDHRGMSQPFWKGQPQHYNAGHHAFLHYEDEAGKMIGTEYLNDTVNSYGPTYADIALDYVTDDGKIKVSLNHMEMPQTDENRGYYEITYTVLEDLTISNFREDFALYSVFGYSYYKYLGYLDENNNCATKEMLQPDGVTVLEPKYHTLGNDHPYFDLYYMSKANAYSNLAFIIASSEIVIGGEKSSAAFALKENYQMISLTLDINGEVNLKKDDSFKIKAIILPWGGGWKEGNVVEFDATDYSIDTVTDSDGKKVYHVNNDESVRRVRLDSIVNRITASAVSDCTVTDSYFLPTVLSSDGKQATFTVSGGYDFSANASDTVNVTVLAKGFDALSVPVIEELVEGEWVEYTVSSKDTPDPAGTVHEYDGYSVTYDNGKYNYSFVTEISDGNERTFRISVVSRGIEYKLSEGENSFSIVGLGDCTDSSVVIPESYNGLPVTSIESCAFVSRGGIESIRIPVSVTKISMNNAFAGDFANVTVTVDAENPNYYAEGNKIFDKATGNMIWCGSEFGDVDGENGVSTVDIVELRKYYANYDYENDVPQNTVCSGADINGDGVMSIDDLILLRKYFAYYDYDKNVPGIELGGAE